MHRIYISIGSNINAEQHIRAAIHLLQKYFGTLLISRVYESEAVGFEGDNFLNLVIGADTTEDVENVAKQLRKIEDQHGRIRTGPRFSSRSLDLDLLLYNDLILKKPDIELPRDEITKNAFVLWPLAEIAPQLAHPCLDLSISELWHDFDKLSQKLWPIDFQW